MSIAEFYDRYPYPPPPADLHAYAERWRGPQRLRANFHLLFPGRTYQEHRTILVAGCGTAQAARYAIRHPDASVVGIDVSASSLDEERRLASLHGLTNLELHEMAVEQVGDLDGPFDEIVCTGVLHHLADPLQGLRALASILADDGAMHLMLYARYGRVGVAMIQELAHRLDLKPERDEILALAGTLREVPPGHPVAYRLRESPDFRSVDALADAVLNPREQAYSVPEVLELVAASGLTFGRWYRQAPYVARVGLATDTPLGERLAALPLDEQFAAMELLRGSITTHSLIVRPGARGDALPMDPLEDDGWRGLVPLRMAGAITVEERVPEDAAAVLLNQEHTFTDLVLPVDDRGKAIVDAVDGERSISSIIDSHGPHSIDRSFFSTLWWADQVVFDASGGRAPEAAGLER